MKKVTKRTLTCRYPKTFNIRLVCLFLVSIMILFMETNILQASEEEQPDAAVILDKFVEVTGGLGAYNRIQNRVIKGIFEIPQAGIRAEWINYQSRPNKIYVKFENKALGTIENGSNGEVVWEKSTMDGPRIKEGEERDNALQDTLFDPEAYWREAYKKVEWLGIEKINFKPCYKVLMVPNVGASQTFYFDTKTYLLLKLERTEKIQMGAVHVEIFTKDYKKVDDILLPHKLIIRAMGQERIMKANSIEQNVKIPDDLFKLPEDIQALLEKSDK